MGQGGPSASAAAYPTMIQPRSYPTMIQPLEGGGAFIDNKSSAGMGSPSVPAPLPLPLREAGDSRAYHHQQLLASGRRGAWTQTPLPLPQFGFGDGRSQDAQLSQPPQPPQPPGADPLALDAYMRMMGGGTYGGVIPQQSTAYPPNPWQTLQTMGFPNQQQAASAGNSSSFGATPWSGMFRNG